MILDPVGKCCIVVAIIEFSSGATGARRNAIDHSSLPDEPRCFLLGWCYAIPESLRRVDVYVTVSSRLDVPSAVCVKTTVGYNHREIER